MSQSSRLSRLCSDSRAGRADTPASAKVTFRSPSPADQTLSAAKASITRSSSGGVRGPRITCWKEEEGWSCSFGRKRRLFQWTFWRSSKLSLVALNRRDIRHYLLRWRQGEFKYQISSSSAIPESALYEEDSDDEDDVVDDNRDDKRSGTRYHVFFLRSSNLILIQSFPWALMVPFYLRNGGNICCCAVNRGVCSTALSLQYLFAKIQDAGMSCPTSLSPARLTPTAMWMRVVSSWMFMLLYIYIYMERYLRQLLCPTGEADSITSQFFLAHSTLLRFSDVQRHLVLFFWRTLLILHVWLSVDISWMRLVEITVISTGSIPAPNSPLYTGYQRYIAPLWRSSVTVCLCETKQRVDHEEEFQHVISTAFPHDSIILTPSEG